MKKLCRCGKKIDYYTKACDECLAEMEKEKRQRVKRYDRDIRNSSSNSRYTQFYNSKQWEILSDIVKRNFHGICPVCDVDHGLLVESDTTHHIVELREDFSLRLVEDNLIPLCHDCHNKLHANYTEKEKEYLKGIILKFKRRYDYF